MLIRLSKKLPLLPLLVYLADLGDPYGADHSKRVAGLCSKLGKACGYVKTEELELSAMLHDIGKIGIPEFIRRLPGKYTDIERLVMQQHSVMGEKLLRLVQNGTIDSVVISNVRHHHEDWGGTGYPDGLKGEAIPLGARIIRIVDYYDAITNVRGYVNRMSHEDAVRMLREEQDKKRVFDPKLFEIFTSDEFWR